jgi:N-acetylneuraminate synthase/N,N'-diacetyllegionaminate synthase
MQEIQINNFTIGKEYPCFIIAEAGVNHNGSLEMALELVRKAKETGVDCVKFQTFKAERVVTPDAPKANYQLEVTDKSESQFDMLKKLELTKEDYQQIIKLCQELDIVFLSTPYSEEDTDFLEELGVPAYKIASGQLTEPSFLAHVASKNKPLIVSTGMANLAEVYEGVKAIQAMNNEQLVVLQCTTNYPSSLEDANINAMNAMQEALQVIIGYSDHVPNNYACFAAVAKGAKVIEKHFTLDKNLPGPDHSSSLNPEEMAELVTGIRSIEKSLGSKIKQPTKAELKNKTGMRRSIVINSFLPKGAIVTKEVVSFKRPATGIAPKMLAEVIGKKVVKDIAADTILKWK